MSRTDYRGYGDAPLSRAERRAALVRACEYDRLQVRLACARAALEQKRKCEIDDRVSAVARTIFRYVSVGDILKIAAMFLAKK